MRIYSILCFLALLMLGCGPDYDPKTQYPSKIEHEYDKDAPKQVMEPTTAESDDQTELYTLYRDLWQNPIAVIRSMGDLKGKTLADIGAGPYGYFSMMLASRTNVGKVIAIDIDEAAIGFMEDAKKLLPDTIQKRIETRLVTPEDPKLAAGEADIILIVNTAIYFQDRVQYFKNLLKGLSKDGKLVVIDYKMRTTPVGPPLSERIALGTMESQLNQAGYSKLASDDQQLEYQYIIIASK